MTFNIALTQIVLAETWEKGEGVGIEGSIAMIDQDGLRLSFDDFYCYLQMLDYINACFYAQTYFELAIKYGKLEDFLLEIHARIAKHLFMAYPAPFSLSGQYATIQPHLIIRGEKVPTKIPVAAIPDEVSRFSTNLRTRVMDNADGANAISCAGSVLLNIGHIHPFANGNGRLARVMMNCVLAHYNLGPIYFDDKEEYYRCFETLDLKSLTEIINRQLLNYVDKGESMLKDCIPSAISDNENIFQFIRSEKQIRFTNSEGEGIDLADPSTIDIIISEVRDQNIKSFLEHYKLNLDVYFNGFCKAHLPSWALSGAAFSSVSALVLPSAGGAALPLAQVTKDASPAETEVTASKPSSGPG